MRASVKAIEHFESATALVGGVTLHYWLGGDPRRASNTALAWLSRNELFVA
jgi:hypothetical protein